MQFIEECPVIDENPVPVVKSMKDFQREIELIVKTKRVDYMEAVLLYCSVTGLEIETAGQLIKSSAKMKALIQEEAEQLNYLPKSAKLPLSDDE